MDELAAHVIGAQDTSGGDVGNYDALLLLVFEEVIACRMCMVDSVMQVGSILISTGHVAMELKTMLCVGSWPCHVLASVYVHEQQQNQSFSSISFLDLNTCPSKWIYRATHFFWRIGCQAR